jgi:hypothetical protein
MMRGPRDAAGVVVGAVVDGAVVAGAVDAVVVVPACDLGALVVTEAWDGAVAWEHAVARRARPKSATAIFVILLNT